MTTPTNSGDSVAGAVRDLAAQLSQPDLPYTPPQIVKAVVVNTALTGTPPTVSINLSGDTTQIDGVRFLESYSPVVGDVLAIAKTGPDLLILGAYAQGASSWTTPTLGSGFSQNGDSQGNVQYRLVWDNGSLKMQWQGCAAVSGSGTGLVTTALDAAFRPSAQRKFVVARGLGNGAAFLDVQVVFATNGTVSLAGNAPTAPAHTHSLGTSATENAQHDHYSYSPYTGLSYLTNTENEQHAHAMGNSTGTSGTLPTPDWVSLHGVEYFL